MPGGEAMAGRAHTGRDATRETKGRPHERWDAPRRPELRRVVQVPGHGYIPARALRRPGGVQLSLNGTWKFRYCPDPGDLTAGFEAADFDYSRFDDITVPSCWQPAGIPGPPRYGAPRTPT